LSARCERERRDRGPAKRRSRLPAPALGALAALIAFPCEAAPQYNAGLLAGAAARGVGSSLWADTVFYGGIRGDVMLGRTAPGDFGAGPYVAVTTAAFDDARLAGGGSLHLPMDDTFPLVLSAGAFARAFDGAVKPGMQTQLFFGTRSYNYHADYVIAAGLVAGVDYSLSDGNESVFVLAAQIDGLLLALPFIILGQAL
jgi:hypothetical protein